MTLTAVEGIFKDGRIELRETPKDIREARVIVTFLVSEEPATALTDLTSHQLPPPEMQGSEVGEDDPFGDDQPRFPTRALATSTERLHAFQSLLESLPPAPTVPLAAFDREDLYP